MPMPRPRTNSKKKEEPPSWGVHILTTLLGGAISLALIWCALQVFMAMMGHMSLNTQLSTAKGMVTPYATQWKLSSSVEYKAGFTCDDKENPCPSFRNEYATDKPVTVKQLESVVPGTNEVVGDCLTADESKMLCQTDSTSGIFQYHAEVKEAGEGQGYLIVISAHPPKQ